MRVQNHSLHAKELARRARLRYTSDQQPGVRRSARGDRFVFLTPAGRPVRNAAELARFRKLAIPPAWTDVWICPHANGHLQATGRDARHRKQYLYHPLWQQVAAKNKFARLRQFGESLPRLRRQIKRQLALPELTRKKVAATVLELLDQTLVRVGNEEYARSNGSYGLTTLRNRHARIRGHCLRLRFQGKSGLFHEVGIRDRRVARIVRQCQELPGQHLFQFRDQQGIYRRLDSSDINRLLKEITGLPFTAKDFRTWKATVLVLKHLLSHDRGTMSATAARRVVKEALHEASAALGNTVTICRKYYVHPQVIELFERGELPRACSPIPSQRRNRLAPHEQLLLRLLRRLEKGKRRAAALSVALFPAQKERRHGDPWHTLCRTSPAAGGQATTFRRNGEATMARTKSSKRERINTGRDVRFVRRDASGQFKESDDAGKSLRGDRRRRAKTSAKSGQGDRGDRRRKK